MIELDLSVALVLYPVLGLAVVGGLWFYYDRRDRQLYDRTRCKTTFHCLKCDHVYSHAGGDELCPCPRCGHSNPRLHF